MFDTKKLNFEQLVEVVNDLENHINDIKHLDKFSSEYKERLFEYKYYITAKHNSSEKVIDLGMFIKIFKIKVLEEYQKYNINSHTKKFLDRWLKENLFLRIKNNFEFIAGPPRKRLNKFLGYLRESTISTVKNFFRDVESKISEENVYCFSERGWSSEKKIRLGDYSVIAASNFLPPEIHFIKQEKLSLITNCIKRLSEKQQFVLIKNKIQDINQKDIANILDISQQAVSRLVNRAQDNLWEMLKKEYDYNTLKQYKKS